jgi:uncharacterized protein DUF4410
VKKNVGLILAIFLIAGLVLTGCASQVKKSDLIQPSVQREKLQNIQISINPNRRFAASRHYDESMDELRRVLQEKIASAIPDAKVTIGNTPAAIGPGLRISLTVLDFQYVAGSARLLSGMMSGNALLRVKVELSDLQTNTKNGESILGTTSSAKEGIFGGITSRQIDAVSDSIVAMIVSTPNPVLQETPASGRP